MDSEDRHWRSRPYELRAPHYLRPWLTDEASLTARIRARCTEFHVRILRQGMALPNEDERRLIGLGSGKHAWRREVLLIADNRPVVFAHSILAPCDRRGAWRLATAIGGRPLGAALFADPLIVRSPLHVARLDNAHPLHRRAEAALDCELPTLWARRSRFRRTDRPLLVTEVFLPDLLNLQAGSKRAVS